MRAFIYNHRVTTGELTQRSRGRMRSYRTTNTDARLCTTSSTGFNNGAPIRLANIGRDLVGERHGDSRAGDRRCRTHPCGYPRITRAKFDVRPIFSPTVPAGSERLRICLHAFNTDDEMRLLCDTFGVRCPRRCSHEPRPSTDCPHRHPHRHRQNGVRGGIGTRAAMRLLETDSGRQFGSHRQRQRARIERHHAYSPRNLPITALAASPHTAARAEQVTIALTDLTPRDAATAADRNRRRRLLTDQRSTRRRRSTGALPLANGVGHAALFGQHFAHGFRD